MLYPLKTSASFIAGKLTAYLYIEYRDRDDLPSLILCMRDFLHLKTIFNRYYNLLRLKIKYEKFFLEYESYVEQMRLDEESIGDVHDFMIGYGITIYEHYKKKKNLLAIHKDKHF